MLMFNLIFYWLVFLFYCCVIEIFVCFVFGFFFGRWGYVKCFLTFYFYQQRDNCNAVLEAYVENLIEGDHKELVSFYVSKLTPEAQVHWYARFLEGKTQGTTMWTIRDLGYSSYSREEEILRIFNLLRLDMEFSSQVRQIFCTFPLCKAKV